MTSITPRFSIIISWTEPSAFPQSCIDSVLENTSEGQTPFELILVHPEDAGAAISSDVATRAKVISVAGQNDGVMRNAGAEVASSHVLVFLDPDINVTSGWLQALSGPLSRNEVGVVGAMIVNLDSDTVTHAGYVFNAPCRLFYPIYQHFQPEFHGVRKQRQFRAVSGACLLVRKSVFSESGGFSGDEFEDIDFCLKAGGMGHVVVYAPGCVVSHRGTLRRIQSTRSQESFWERWNTDAVQSDDEKYCFEDGMRIHFNENRKLSYSQVFTESYANVADALRLKTVGKSKEAEERLLNAVVVYPGNTEAYVELYSIQMESEDYSRAIEYCDRLIGLNPPFIRAHLLKAQALIALGHRKIAKQILEGLWKSSEADNDLKKEARAMLQKT